MKKRKKLNGSNGIEVIYDETAQPDKFVMAVLEAHQAGTEPIHPEPADKPSVREQPLPTVTPMAIPPAGVLHFGPSDSALFVKWTSRRSAAQWLPVARFSPRTLGSYKAIVGRRFVAPVTADAVASLEAAHGNASDYGNADIPAESVELDDAVITTNPRNGTWIPWVQHRGLWFGLCPPISRINTYAKTQAAKDADRRRQQGYPDLAVI